MELFHQSISLNEDGAMVMSSDGIDFSASLSIDKKRADNYLILALVDQLSSYIEPNEPNKPAKVLLGHLVRRKLIAEHLLQDFDKDISGIRKAFKVLISQITVEISDCFSRSDQNALMRYQKSHKQNMLEVSRKNLLDETPNIPRFRLDFKVIETLGKGGFGQVFKAQHNVDGNIYAIKQVSMKDFKKPACNAVREVKILANLLHPNIVRYHNCWLEADFPRRPVQRLRELKNSSSVNSSEFSCSLNYSLVDNDDLEIVFETSSNEAHEEIINGTEEVVKQDSRTSFELGVPEHIYSSSFPESSSISNHFRQVSSARKDSLRQPQCGLTLNIQMQCCDTDLAAELAKRLEIDYSNNLKLMTEMLSGLDYLHSMGIIHRDITPSNLFLTKNTLQIGDVGLARYSLNERENHKLCEYDKFSEEGDLTRSIGTFLYSAPEMSHNSSIDYNCSSDIFSGGIILYEIFNIFQTKMERIETLQRVRDGNLPRDFQFEHPEISLLVKNMTNLDPNKRPTARELLQEPLFSKPQAPDQSELIIKQQHTQIERLKHKLEQERVLNRQLCQQLSEFNIFRKMCVCQHIPHIEDIR